MTFTRRAALLSWSAALLAAAPDISVAQPVSDPAAGQQGGATEAPNLSPEQKMQRRFPQPIRTGDLIGLPVLDENDSTIGYIQQVVRTPTGQIKLIVPYAKLVGWARLGGMLDGFRRPVPVPLEVVAILGRQVAALDMPREGFDAAPTWQPSEGAAIPADEIIRIAIARR